MTPFLTPLRFITVFQKCSHWGTFFLKILRWYMAGSTIPKSISFPGLRSRGLHGRTRRSLIGVTNFLIGFQCQTIVFHFHKLWTDYFFKDLLFFLFLRGFHYVVISSLECPSIFLPLLSKYWDSTRAPQGRFIHFLALYIDCICFIHSAIDSLMDTQIYLISWPL